MNIFAIAALGITAAALSAVLKHYNGEYGMFIGLAASLLILGSVTAALSPVFSLIKELAEETGGNEYIAVLMKALAVCYITGLAADCCRDAGESAIASRIDFAGRIAVVLISVPLFRNILAIIKGLLF